MQQPIWAPWRIEYILSEKPKGCIFCDYPAAPESDDRKNLIVHRSPRSFAILNRYPYNSGHLMVIPRKHVQDLNALSPEEWDDLQSHLRLAVSVVRSVFKPEGMNVGMNLGRAAGAGIEEHLHWHIVPRWVGDNSFMPVLADMRVVVEALDAAWEKLHAGFRSAEGP